MAIRKTNLIEPASGPQTGPRARCVRGTTHAPRSRRSRAPVNTRVEVVECHGKGSDELRRELFGEVRDGVTLPGALQRARGGTAVLEHVDMLPADVQAALAATLGDRIFLHVGGCVPVRLKARVVASLSQGHASTLDPRLLDRLGSISIQHAPPDVCVPRAVPPAAPVQTLRAGSRGEWLHAPDHPPQDLRRRKNLRRILAALVHQHHAAPGKGIPLADLLAIGWPGERISSAAAINRIDVALATLRKFGLRGLLVCENRTYFLDPSLAVKRSELDWDTVSTFAEPAFN